MDAINQALGQGIAPAVIVAIYLVINKIIDNKKEKINGIVTSELIKSINSISSFLSDFTRSVLHKERDKCRNAIETSMLSTAMKLTNFVASTIVNNHIEDNKDAIIINITNIVNSEFYNMVSILSIYEINGVKASEFLNKEWMDIIEQDMISIIYNNSLSQEDKIVSFSNKILIKFQSYITYITNNIIR